MKKFVLTAIIAGGAIAAPAQPIDLAGEWAFRLDPKDEGVAGKWFGQTLPDRIKLPGTLAAQGIGDPVGLNTPWVAQFQDNDWFKDPIYAPYTGGAAFRMPFWLQPDKYYAGAAWFQRTVDIPTDWQGRRVVLELERPHWETTVWLDDTLVGRNDSLFTPHEYDLGTGVKAGKHTLTIRVDNRMVIDVGHNSHCVSDHTQGNWNGLVGRLQLRATNPVWIDDAQVYPNVAGKKARLAVTIGNATAQPGKGALEWSATEKATGNILAKGKHLVDWTASGGKVDFEIELDPKAKSWDEFSPNLLKLDLILSGPETRDQKPETTTVVFGLREIAAQGTQFTLNGRKIFFRGTLECAIFPKTGHPPVDVESWKKVIRACQSHGLNHIRFHSYCPPEAAFEAADELGFYYQVETCWPNQSTTIGDGKPVDDWVYRETDRILKAYGNHPSFLLIPHGNEPGGGKQKEYLAKWIDHFKAKDARRLWSSGSGWPELAENQFHVTPNPRIQAWGQGLKSRINAKPPETTTDYADFIRKRSVPVISHEIGQWCVYPNFDEIPKYTGYLKPKNFEIFRDTLAKNHMGDQARAFLHASGKLQTLCYKEDIESALRTPGMGGFQLLDLHDFPGQGTALVGVLDPFWESKGYVTPEEYRRFCNSTVPLARMAKRVFTTSETFEADIVAANFGAAPLDNAVAAWKLVGDDGKTMASGKLPSRTLPVDNGIPLGKIRQPLSGVSAPSRLKLVVGFEGTRFENDWDVWVYPPAVDDSVPATITVAKALTDETLAALRGGGTVLLTIPPKKVAGDRFGKVALGFSSIFWNTAWTRRQPPHTLGILCDPQHPLFAAFPTDAHSNWQWWYLISRAGAMILDGLPPDLRPGVQVIDDWVTNRRLGLLFEAKLGGGRIVVTSIDLDAIPAENPVARQFRHSLLRYMSGSAFQPAVDVTVEQVRALMASAAPAKKAVGLDVVLTDSEQDGYEGGMSIDGDPKTMWHTSWDDGAPGFPHEIVFKLEKPVAIKGVKLLPRQDKNPNGWIRDYAVCVSNDGNAWGTPVARGAFERNAQEKTVTFPAPVDSRFVKVTALSGFDDKPFSSLAEFDVIPAAR